jgi:hypothetical protein
MRTIVACLFTAVLCAAQNPAEIERLEKKIAAKPDNVPDRVALLVNLTQPAAGLGPEKIREARRRNILWLIEHHPEADIYKEPPLLIPARGRLADPEGSAEAAGLWKEIAARPDASSTLIANAAIYLRALDLPAARAILDGRSTDAALSRARGFVEAAAMLGVSGLGRGVQFGSTAALRATPQAKAARLAIESSADAILIGNAGDLLSHAPAKIENPYESQSEYDDYLALAERWLRRAIELAPPGDEWKMPLGQTLSVVANRTLDPNGRVALLREADSLIAWGAMPEVIARLALAEFDAGDDAAAERDGERALASSQKAAFPYNLAQTALGRIAAAKGDLNEAKKRLLASITMPATLKNAVLEPNMTLAQDFYDAGDRDTVIEFLEASRPLWKFDRGRIDRMISFIRKAPSADLLQLSRQFPGNEVIRRAAPAFEAQDLDGKTWTREQLLGKVAALEFGNAPLAEKVSRDFSGRGAVLLRIQDDDTKRRFEVLTNPTVVMIDRQGIVAAFHAGPATEAEWRTEFESGFGGGPNPASLPAPKQLAEGIAWEAVENAESYVVEWDSRDEKGWIFDQEKTVRVIPTRETSAMLDLNGFTRIRWRVYAVPRSGQPGRASPWREIDGVPFTKIYK